MTPAEIADQIQVDEECLRYVREMQGHAPIRAESVYSFLTRIRRRKLTLCEVEDRLDDLTSEGKLSVKSEWAPGEGNVNYYKITAHGRDVLDGVIEK